MKSGLERFPHVVATFDLTDEMLGEIADWYLRGKSIQQIRGYMTLRYGTIERVFTDKLIKWEIRKMELDKN